MKRKKKTIGLLEVAVGTAAVVVGVPLKMAGDILKAERRAKRKKKGRRR